MPDDHRIVSVDTEQVAIDALRPHPANPRQGDVGAIVESIRANGFYAPIYVQKATGTIIAGHHRWRAAQDLGMTQVPVVYLDVDDDHALRILLADNRTNDLATYDNYALAALLEELQEETGTLAGTGFDGDDLDELLADLQDPVLHPDDADDGDQADTDTLADRFGAPPFTVLDTRQGYWQDRKRAWVALGIESELGRDAVTIKGQDSLNAISAQKRSMADSRTNVTGAPDLPDWASNGMARMAPGTSIFDPVLTELLVRWYAPPDGAILDPFAGGSVRGLVTAATGRHYMGIDLRDEQVAANVQQWRDVGPRITDLHGDVPVPSWQAGDSAEVLPEMAREGDEYDMILTCPPYGDLERYSDDPADLSTMTPDAFLATYRKILQDAAALLRPDRFAAIVVGEYRDRDGHYAGLIPATIDAMRDAGLHFYNEAVLVNSIGTLAIRASRQFTAGRKLGKAHQNVLVFVKGSSKAATAALGDITDAIALPDAPSSDPALGDDGEYDVEVVEA